MNQHELSTRWESLVSAKQDFIMLFADMTDTQCRWQPADGWSANQVLDHLLIAETGTLGYIKKKSSGGWENLENTTDEIRAIAKTFNERLGSNERWKAPDILPQPSNESDFKTLSNRWDELRTAMQDFFSQIQPDHYEKLVFRQPYAGMLNALQALDFMTLHIRHHIMQIERIQNEQGI
ncbi:MAG: DinB family protein [Flavobacteriales bacterium]